MQSIRQAEVRGKRVIVRVDMNVPFDERGRILDDFRIREGLGTIRWVLGQGGAVFIILHRGRPKGMEPRLSVRPIANAIQIFLKRPVAIVKNPIRENPEKYRGVPVLISENIRFFAGEGKNDPKFARSLARWGEIYANDAFAVSHRASASIVGLASLMPAYGGLLLQKEVELIDGAFKRPKRPFIAILGGAKVSTKMPYVKDLMKKADKVVLGGALLNTVLAAEGKETGRSLVDRSMYREARKISRSPKLFLPQDVTSVIKGKTRNANVGETRANDYILDIGSAATKEIARAIIKARTILWNGSLGNTDLPKGDKATKAIFAAIKKSKARVVLGGGDLTVFAKTNKLPSRIFILTGGGAMLEYVAKGTLPGIKALE